MEGFSALAIQFGDDEWWVLSSREAPENLDPASHDMVEITPGYKGTPSLSPQKQAPIRLRILREGSPVIQLLETRSYDWHLLGMEDAEIFSDLEAVSGNDWLVRNIRGHSGSFKVVNYLGFSDFTLQSRNSRHRLDLEIISPKIDFHTEFRKITEDIAGFCQQLLLSSNSPTSLKFVANPDESAETNLEQFLFLRSALSSERVEEIMGMITSRPHSVLKKETEWVPLSQATSQDWVLHPTRMARAWRQSPVIGTHRPEEVLSIRKEDSQDTAANQFIKFALLEFRDLCDKIIREHESARNLATEAEELRLSLNSILSTPLLEGISPLTRLPLDNATLQRQDGYRDVLHAWLMMQSAATLQWDRDESAYNGPTRNVATLYEYWIFFQLHKILDSTPEVSRATDTDFLTDVAKPFLERKNGRISIHLKQGQATCAPFLFSPKDGTDLHLHLYYERTFQLQNEASGANSYSRQFRPDYTISIFPARFDSEQKAVEEGQIAYVHFDAKYRAETLSAIFGSDAPDSQSLEQEKQSAKATSTYKRGDLLKMHTYNDAIRQTAGSYVLYPGDQNGTSLRKYHEILPGVGAFVMKPGAANYAESIGSFLTEIFRHQSNRLSQYHHYTDLRNQIVKDEPKPYGSSLRNRPNASCLLIYVPNKLEELFLSKRLAYCRALKDDEAQTPLRITLGSMSGAIICPYQGSQISRTSLSWLATIQSCELLTRKSLSHLLLTEGWPEDQLPKSASAYLFFRLGEPIDSIRRNVTSLTPKGAFHAVSARLHNLEDCSTQN